MHPVHIKTPAFAQALKMQHQTSEMEELIPLVQGGKQFTGKMAA